MLLDFDQQQRTAEMLLLFQGNVPWLPFKIQRSAGYSQSPEPRGFTQLISAVLSLDYPLVSSFLCGPLPSHSGTFQLLEGR